MKLPWRPRNGVSNPDPANDPENQGPRSEVYPSPGFEAMVSELPRGETINVLDLGPAVPENIDFMASFASRIQLVDALREAFNTDRAVQTLGSLVSEFAGAFHMVLLWDFLNYLTPVHGAELVKAVAPLCRPDARCLAMTVTSETMPASPHRFRVKDRGHLTYEWSSTDEVGAPQMTPAAVERILAGFSIEHAFVLRNGVREYVATRNSPPGKAVG